MSRNTTDIANELLAENAALKGKLAQAEGDVQVGLQLSERLSQQLAQRDAQIAAQAADIQNYSELLQYHIGRQAKAESQIEALTAENVSLKESRSTLAENALEVCNEIAPVYQHEEIMRGLYESTGDRNRYPKPIKALVDEALAELNTPATDGAANALRAEGVEWFATALAHEVMKSGEDYDSWKSAASNAAMEYVEQLREGKA